MLKGPLTTVILEQVEDKFYVPKDYEGIPGIEGTVGCPAGPPGPRVDESRAYDIIYEMFNLHRKSKSKNKVQFAKLADELTDIIGGAYDEIREML